MRPFSCSRPYERVSHPFRSTNCSQSVFARCLGSLRNHCVVCSCERLRSVSNTLPAAPASNALEACPHTLQSMSNHFQAYLTPSTERPIPSNRVLVRIPRGPSTSVHHSPKGTHACTFQKRGSKNQISLAATILPLPPLTFSLSPPLPRPLAPQPLNPIHFFRKREQRQ